MSNGMPREIEPYVAELERKVAKLEEAVRLLHRRVDVSSTNASRDVLVKVKSILAAAVEELE